MSPPTATRGRPIVDVREFPAEALRMLGEMERALPRDGRPPAEPGVAEMRRRLEEGSLRGILLVGPRDEAIGLATWDAPMELGRRALLFLSEGFRNAAVLARFVDLVERAEASALLSFGDLVPPMPRRALEAALVPRGWVEARRVDMVFPADRSIPADPGGAGDAVRSVGPSDAAALARLMDRAYADNPLDRALFAALRDPAEDARLAVESILGGGVGSFSPEASYGVERGDELVAATLVNDLHGPLVTEVMVDPRARRHGHASRLLRESLRAVRARSGLPPRLVVTTGNLRAKRVYSALGFVEVPSSETGVWLHRAALGLG